MILDNETIKDIKNNINRFYTIMRYYDTDRVLTAEERMKCFDESYEYEQARLIRMIDNIVDNSRVDWEKELKRNKPKLLTDDNVIPLLRQQES